MTNPDPAPIPLPSDNADSARVFLEAHGLFAQNPPIRASHFTLGLSDPFLYYLSVRLGLVPFFSYSEALARGSWFHTAMQSLFSPDPARFRHHATISRTTELKTIGRTLGVSPSSLRLFLDREDRDRQTAYAWSQIILDLPLQSSSTPTLRHLLNRYNVLGAETVLRCPITVNHITLQRTIQADLLLHNPDDNTIWIADWKTCAESPIDRLVKAPFEMATHHYLSVLSDLISSGEFQSFFNLPLDVRLGGFIHVAFQKCPLRFGLNDRPYEYKRRTLSRGPRKGQEITELEYYGEPSFALFLGRCTEWYTRTGRYATEPFESPPLNLSTISAGILLDPSALETYYSRLKYLHSLNTREAYPANFLANPDSIIGFGGSPFPYAPFYANPVSQWPRIIGEERFIVRHRDDPESLNPVTLAEDPHDQEEVQEEEPEVPPQLGPS
jgi:hypothetical protein